MKYYRLEKSEIYQNLYVITLDIVPVFFQSTFQDQCQNHTNNHFIGIHIRKNIYYTTLQDMTSICDELVIALKLIYVRDRDKLQQLLSKYGYTLSRSNSIDSLQQLAEVIAQQNGRNYILSMCTLLDEFSYVKDNTNRIRSLVQPSPLRVIPDALSPKRPADVFQNYEIQNKVQTQNNANSTNNVLQVDFKQSESHRLKYETEINTLKAEVNQWKAKATELNVEKENIIKENIQLKTRLHEEQDKFKAISEQQKAIQTENSHLKAHIDRIGVEQSTQSQVIQKLQETLQQYEILKRKLEAENIRIKNELDESTQIIPNFTRGKEDLDNQIRQLNLNQQYIKKLESELLSQKNQLLEQLNYRKTLCKQQNDVKADNVQHNQLRIEQDKQIEELLTRNKEFETKLSMIGANSEKVIEQQKNQFVQILQQHIQQTETDQRKHQTEKAQLQKEVERLTDLLNAKWEILQNWDRGFASQDDNDL